MSIKHPVLIGSDPEIFLFSQGSKFINAHLSLGRLVNGTKAQPELTDYGAIQVDGTAIELNTIPTDDPQKFVEMLAHGMADTETRFRILAGKIQKTSVVSLPPEWFEDGEMEPGLEMGCDPDFNAWNNGEANPTPDSSSRFRTAGGHVHIGWTQGKDIFEPSHFTASIEMAQQMDYALGLWSLNKDKDGGARRKLYGKAGAFRPKHYGVEYRVLSNFWMFDADLSVDVHKRATKAAALYLDGHKFTKKFGRKAADLIEAGTYTSECHDLLELVDEDLQKAA